MAVIQVSVNGASCAGNAGVTFTGKNGRFAGDVMRSEESGEDVDYNGKKSETFQARVSAMRTGVFMGETFSMPSVQGGIVQGSGVVASDKSCRPPACDGLDLGNIAVEFEEPRVCEVALSVTFSGQHRIAAAAPSARAKR